MVKQIFKAGNLRDTKFPVPDEAQNDFLRISELFYDTIQGEGRYAGFPAVFMRLQGCVLNCHFCDSSEVWREGQARTFNEIFKEFEEHGIIERFENGHHFIITGGSPLKQQKRLINFLTAFEDRFQFLPIIEIENETSLIPQEILMSKVFHWNNSPKLNHSQNDRRVAYRPDAILAFRDCGNVSWKFVVEKESDWDEIEEFYIKPNLIRKKDIVLMPCGATREELMKTREMAIQMAVSNNVLFMDRLHVVAWDKKTGV